MAKPKRYTPPMITLFDHPALGWQSNDQTKVVAQAVFDAGGMAGVLRQAGAPTSYSQLEGERLKSAEQAGVSVIRELASKGYQVVKIVGITDYRKHYPKAKVTRHVAPKEKDHE